MGGYLYFHKAPDSIEFDKECKRLLKEIAFFDVLRSDKCISSHGLEPRTPFLDRAWVEFYLSIPKDIRNHQQNKQCEKFLLRNAISEYDKNLIPFNILWRTKEAFSDGVSGQSRSWYQIIQEKIETLCVQNPDLREKLQEYMRENKKTPVFNAPKTLEQAYYRCIYEEAYSGTARTIPHFWMPRFVDSN